MSRSVLVSLLVVGVLSGCAPRTRATAMMVFGSMATATGSIMLANLGTPEACQDHPDPSGEPPTLGMVAGQAAACGGAAMVEALPPAMLASTGASLLLGGIIAYVLAPRPPRQARPAPLEKLRGERWTRLRDVQNRGRSGR